jgi:hypothetical protein
LPQVKWAQGVSKRNVQRVAYELIEAVKGATYPTLVASRKLDHYSPKVKYSHAPFYLKPRWSYTYNTIAWDNVNQVLSVYHWVTDGFSIDPLQLVNNMFIYGDPVRGLLSVPSKVTEILPVRTSILTDAVKEIESNKIVRLSERPLSDFVDFMAMPFHDLPFKDPSMIKDNLFKSILTFTT